MSDNIKAEWRCFHCDDVFTDRRCAEAHFGPNEESAPACQIKAGAEGSLVRALRDVERELADVRADLATESTEASKVYYSQQTRHYAQLQAAEEAGYERGLADSRPSPSEGDVERVARAMEPRAWNALGKENDNSRHRDARVLSLKLAKAAISAISSCGEERMREALTKHVDERLAALENCDAWLSASAGICELRKVRKLLNDAALHPSNGGGNG